MRLYDADAKQKLSIIQILDESLDKRLKDFGFKSETKMVVLSKTKQMFLVKVNNSVFAINEALAKLISVKIDSFQGGYK